MGSNRALRLPGLLLISGLAHLQAGVPMETETARTVRRNGFEGNADGGLR